MTAPTRNITSQFRGMSAKSSPSAVSGARNLYELFVQDAAALVSGACQANETAHTLFLSLPADEICLREAVLGLSTASRAYLPHLPPILLREGIVLSPTHDCSACALLATLEPEACEDLDGQWRVFGTRTLSGLRNVALYLRAQARDAAEIAGILGSAALQEAFLRWSEVWERYLTALLLREPGFRAQAYAGGMIENRPRWQHA